MRLTCEPYWLTAQMPCVFLVSSSTAFWKVHSFLVVVIFCFCYSINKMILHPKCRTFFMCYNTFEKVLKKIKPCFNSTAFLLYNTCDSVQAVIFPWIHHVTACAIRAIFCRRFSLSACFWFLISLYFSCYLRDLLFNSYRAQRSTLDRGLH